MVSTPLVDSKQIIFDRLWFDTYCCTSIVWKRGNQCVQDWSMSEIRIRKKSGPSTLPWGTALTKSLGAETFPLTTKICLRSCRDSGSISRVVHLFRSIGFGESFCIVNLCVVWIVNVWLLILLSKIQSWNDQLNCLPFYAVAVSMLWVLFA